MKQFPLKNVNLLKARCFYEAWSIDSNFKKQEIDLPEASVFSQADPLFIQISETFPLERNVGVLLHPILFSTTEYFHSLTYVYTTYYQYPKPVKTLLFLSMSQMLIPRGCLKQKVLGTFKPVCLSTLFQFRIFPGQSLISSVYTEHSTEEVGLGGG